METRIIKKILLISLGFFLFPFFVVQGATLSKPANNLGLQLYYSFNEATSTKLIDYSGNGRVGTLNDFSHPPTISSGWSNGRIGGSLTFDGVDDDVSFSSLSIGTTHTISFWIKPSSGADYQTVIADTNGFNGIYYRNSSRLIDFVICCFSDNQNTTPLTEGVWNHVVVVNNAGSITFYLNGVQDGTANPGGGSYSAVQIGASEPNTVEDLTGSLDELRVYNRVLSATEVLNLYKTGLIKINSSQNNVVKNGLIGWWTFDGGDFTDKLYDKSGNGNNGYVFGGATSTIKRLGKIGQGVYFNNSAPYINLGSPASFDNLNTKTVTMRVNRSVLHQSQQVLVKKDSGGTAGWYIDLRGSIFNSGPNTVRYEHNWDASPSSFAIWYGSTLLNSTSTWYHIAVAYDKSSTLNIPQIYVNGVADTVTTSQAPSGSSNSDASSDLLVGAEGSLTEFHNGGVDDLRIYNRILSASEIKQIYNSTVGSKINSSQNNFQGSTLNSGLLGLWSFNGQDITDKVYDRSGNSLNGYYNGRATSTAKVPGKIGQGLSFNGSSDSVIVPDSPTLDVSTFSVSLWMNADNFNNFGRLVGRWGNTDLIWLIDTTNTGELYYEIDTDGVLFGECGSNNTTDALLVPKTWYHIVLTYDGTTSRIYRNGTKLNADDPCAGPSTGTARFHIGGDTGEYFQGKIDEVRYYNRALTASEIKQLYLMGR